jgi:hypothetical protein
MCHTAADRMAAGNQQRQSGASVSGCAIQLAHLQRRFRVHTAQPACSQLRTRATARPCAYYRLGTLR